MRLTNIICLGCVLLLPMMSFAQPVGFSFGKEIIIQSSQVSGSSSLTDFPLLISLTDNDLRTTANGGRVEHPNGYDIVFTSDDCLVALDHEIEHYDPATGEYIAWVKVPSLSATSNTSIEMYYGNPSISTDPSVSTTWSASFIGVYHFNSSVTDASGNSNHLTDNSTANFPSAQIGEGRDLNNSTNIQSSGAGIHLTLPSGINSGINDFTFSGWVFLDRDDTAWERIFEIAQSTTLNFFLTPSHDATTPAETRARITTAGPGGEQGVIQSNASANTGAWIHWAVTLDATTDSMKVYRNGVLYGSAAGITLTPNSLGATTLNYFGRSVYATDHYIDAKFDEFRLASVARDTHWVVTGFNNQSNPSSFYTVQAEQPAGDLCGSLPVEWLSVELRSQPEGGISVEWKTALEVNNDYFTIERSGDARAWETVGQLAAVGNSGTVQSYRFLDGEPLSGRSYYRIKQTDIDGKFSHSAIRSILLDTSPGLYCYPNPLTERLTVSGSEQELENLAIFDILHQDVSTHTRIVAATPALRTIDVSSLPPGLYYISTGSATRKVYKLER